MSTSAYQKSWLAKHPGYYKAYKAKYYRERRAETLARVAAHKAANLEKVRANNVIASRNYRAKKGTEAYRAYCTARTRALKAEMIAAYGGKCVCCDENKFEFLTIDHINGRYDANGVKEKSCGTMLYISLKKRGWPKDNYRLLCMNCNFSIGKYGYCPHNLN